MILGLNPLDIHNNSFQQNFPNLGLSHSLVVRGGRLSVYRGVPVIFFLLPIYIRVDESWHWVRLKIITVRSILKGPSFVKYVFLMIFLVRGFDSGVLGRTYFGRTKTCRCKKIDQNYICLLFWNIHFYVSYLMFNTKTKRVRS